MFARSGALNPVPTTAIPQDPAVRYPVFSEEELQNFLSRGTQADIHVTATDNRVLDNILINNGTNPDLGSPFLGLHADEVTLAEQFKMPVVGASNVGTITGGPWAGRRCIGCSLVVDATGNPVIMGPCNEETVVVADVQIHDGQPMGTDISGCL